MKTNPLLEAIQALSPAISDDQMYTSGDLIADVYLRAHTLGLTEADTETIKKLIREASFKRYREKYAKFSTANLTAEELADYCYERLTKPDPESDPEPTLWHYLRAACEIVCPGY